VSIEQAVKEYLDAKMAIANLDRLAARNRGKVKTGLTQSVHFEKKEDKKPKSMFSTFSSSFRAEPKKVPRLKENLLLKSEAKPHTTFFQVHSK
jgi:hypothetical protein